ncbi:MAG: hypothetical protein MUF49_11575 [Oculatellaceae cyanobacterium Prado106]|jgi:hypothetical protein|nr:hypothetical protein [Oculatellaceae cyanobacterium Prado106]
MTPFIAFLVWLIRLIQPMMVPVCFVLAWGIVIVLGWSLWAAMRDGVQRAQQMHEIPCANCRYFTNSYHLKCSVHPSQALSEEAIGCMDFESTDRPIQMIQ